MNTSWAVSAGFARQGSTVLLTTASKSSLSCHLLARTVCKAKAHQCSSRQENIRKHIPLNRARRTEAHIEVRRDDDKQPVELRYVVFFPAPYVVSQKKAHGVRAVGIPGAFFLRFYSSSFHCTLNMRLSALCSSSMRISIMSKSLRISMSRSWMCWINPIYSRSIWAVFKIPLSFHYTGLVIGIPRLDDYNPQYIG